MKTLTEQCIGYIGDRNKLINNQSVNKRWHCHWKDILIATGENGHIQ